MSTPDPPTRASRIAIKFGASSGGTKAASSGSRRGPPTSALGKRQRPNALNEDSDSENEDNTIAKDEIVSTISFDHKTSTDNGVPGAKRQNKEFVINSLKNRDWRVDVKARRGAKPSASRTSPLKDNDAMETTPADQDTDAKWGLNVKKISTEERSVSPENDKLGNDEGGALVKPAASPPSQDVDKEAMDALLGKRKAGPDLIITYPAPKAKTQISEQDAYERSVREAAEVSTIEEYSDIPEGEFGAAMLRGMGWKGEELGSKPKEVKRRPHLMGLGSKEDEEIKKGELAKKHGHRERRPRLDEYRRDREKEKAERDGRYRDSYKSERDRERREYGPDYRSKDRYREDNRNSHRSRR
ncbi:hypothetical protein F5Y17DRAFT_299244 [Xylariaceae sp. FL0594]|nr:hypothetical protein F5Y17DRAFT_299244 [Xylariaceae sp. FL0594]